MDRPSPLAIAPEQTRYAHWLRLSGGLGLGALLLAFAAYIGGVLDPLVPIAQLPQAWRLPAADLLKRNALEPGWGWAARLASGDMLNLLGIAILAGSSVLPLAAIAIAWLRRGDRLYAALCALQIAVLMAAASGRLGGP